MIDVQSYFSVVKETNEGWRADCPRCEDREMKLYWNTEKQVGCCHHASCPWYKDHGGVTVGRLRAFLGKGIFEYSIPEVIKAAPEADLKLPKEFETLEEMKPGDSEPIYDYLESRGLQRKLLNMAKVGYCKKGKFWGYIIFPVFDEEGNVIYWQARRFKNREKKWHNPTSSLKSEIIYRIHSPRRPKSVVIVESIINLLTLETKHMGSHTPMLVSILGSSLSDSQRDKILMYERHVTDLIIALDGDAMRAAVPIAEKFLGIFPCIRIARFPDDKDINALGREESWDRIRKAEVFKKSERTRWMVEA